MKSEVKCVYLRYIIDILFFFNFNVFVFIKTVNLNYGHIIYIIYINYDFIKP